MMTISNQLGTLKCLLSNFTKTAYQNYTKWNSSNPIDTFSLSFPVSKQSITKRIFTNDGRLYLLNSLENNIIFFDIFKNQVIDTIEVSENAIKNSYTIFNDGDSTSYEFHKSKVESQISEPLTTIKDIFLKDDTLYVSTSNYFIFFKKNEIKIDTFLTHFQSIHIYPDNEYYKTLVPTNILQRLVDSNIKFYSENVGLYVFGNNVYTTIYNKSNQDNNIFHAIGKYSISSNKLTSIVKLSEEYEGNYNFYSPPIYSNGYAMLPKSDKLFDLQTGNYQSLNFFKQEKFNKIFPEYLTQALYIDTQFYKVLYRKKSDENSIYFSLIDKKKNTIYRNEKITTITYNLDTNFDPYNSNYIIQYFENNKIIRTIVNN